MAFTGFSREGERFFAQLAALQDREWFKQHKEEYVELWEQPMKALFEELAPKLSKQYRGFELDPPKHFRIYRDVRFSKDKAPFKTHIASYIKLAGPEEEGAPAAIYAHFGADEEIAAGHWMLPPERVKRYRAVVADEKLGRELEKRVSALEKKGFTVDSFDPLKRVPAPYPKDHPRARLLKMRGLGISFPKTPKGVRHSPKLVKWIAEQSAHAAPLIVWLEERL